MTSAYTHPLIHSDVYTALNREPRILDLRLAEALGFAQPYDIRKIIERHKPALERLGEVFATVAKTSAKGGRPTSEYHLNKEQAIYICSKSETANAVDITLHVIEVFDAATRQDSITCEPAPASPAVEPPAFSEEETLHLVSLRMRGMRILTTMRDGLQTGSRVLKDSERVVDVDDQADIARFLGGLDAAQLSLLSLYIWGHTFGRRGIVPVPAGCEAKLPILSKVRGMI